MIDLIWYATAGIAIPMIFIGAIMMTASVYRGSPARGQWLLPCGVAIALVSGAGRLFYEKSADIFAPSAPIPAPPTIPPTWLTATNVFIALVFLLVIAGGLYAGTRVVRKRRIAQAAAEKTRQEAADAEELLRARFTKALGRVDTIRDELGALRTDVVTALDYQSLWDMTVPASENFFTSWGPVTDRASILSERAAFAATDIDAFEAAVSAAEAKWHIARDQAKHTGLNNLPATDRATAKKARRYLQRATNPASSPSERELAWARAATLLADLNRLHLPETTRAQIAGRTSPALEAS